MNSINIHHKHSYDKDQAWIKAEEMLEELANKYGLTIEHDGNGQVSFSGSGISGTVEIHHNEIYFNATLSFLMIAMKGIITNEIQNKLNEKFD